MNLKVSLVLLFIVVSSFSFQSEDKIYYELDKTISDKIFSIINSEQRFTDIANSKFYLTFHYSDEEKVQYITVDFCIKCAYKKLINKTNRFVKINSQDYPILFYEDLLYAKKYIALPKQVGGGTRLKINSKNEIIEVLSLQ